MIYITPINWDNILGRDIKFLWEKEVVRSVHPKENFVYQI